jgi:hydrogenase small subunit
MPFLDEPPGAHMSTAAVNLYGKTVSSLRQFTLASMNREPPRPAGHAQPDAASTREKESHVPDS